MLKTRLLLIWILLLAGACLLVFLIVRTGETNIADLHLQEADLGGPKPLPLNIPSPQRTWLGPQAAAERNDSLSSLQVRTVNREFSPVANATVYLSIGDEVSNLGATDVQGELVTQYSSSSTLDSRPISITAVCSGYLTTSVSRERLPSDEITLILGYGASIQGQVLLPDGSAAQEGIRVIAWRQGAWPSVATIENVLRALPLHPISVTDGNGHFVISGLHPSEIYALAAGGRGLVCRTPVQSVLAGTTNAVIMVQPLYGASVSIRQLGGQPLPTDDRLIGRPSPSWRLADKETQPIFDARLVTLAGIAANIVHRSNYSYETVFLCTKDVFAPRIGPVKYAVSAPGFKPVKCDVWLEQVQDAMPQYNIELEPFPGVAFGDVSIEVVGCQPDSLLHLSETVPLGTLTLRPRDPPEGHAIAYRCAIIPDAAGKQVISGVPYGHYEASFVAASGVFRVPGRHAPAGDLCVGPESTRYILDWSRVGSVLVEVLDNQGRRMGGTVMITITCSEGNETSPYYMTFVDEPYIVDGLIPARYRFRVRLDYETRSGPKYAELKESAEIVVVQGVQTRVVVGGR